MIVEWDMAQNDGVLFARTNAPVYALIRSGNSILCGCNDGTVIQFDIFSKSIIRQIRLFHSSVFDIADTGEHYLIAFENGYLGITDHAFKAVRELRLSDESLRKILVTDDAIWMTGKDGIIRKLDKAFNSIAEFKADDLTIFSIAISPRENFLFTGGRSAMLKIWEDAVPLKVINAHWYHIKDISFSPSGKIFTTCSMDKTIKLWDASNFELLKVIDFEKYEAHRSSVNKILWIGRNRFISCSDDRTILCFEIKE